MKTKRISKRHTGCECILIGVNDYAGREFCGTIAKVANKVAQVIYDYTDENGCVRDQYTAYVDLTRPNAGNRLRLA